MACQNKVIVLICSTYSPLYPNLNPRCFRRSSTLYIKVCSHVLGSFTACVKNVGWSLLWLRREFYEILQIDEVNWHCLKLHWVSISWDWRLQVLQNTDVWMLEEHSYCEVKLETVDRCSQTFPQALTWLCCFILHQRVTTLKRECCGRESSPNVLKVIQLLVWELCLYHLRTVYAPGTREQRSMFVV